MKPLHVVMVPGFAGFDALGGLNYYVGVCRQFDEWCAGHPDPRAVLRFFDNLPTAGVETRAKKLARYLGSRYARREIQKGDRIALVGHSTGGLDIRRLLADAREKPLASIVEGTEEARDPLRWSELLEMIDRVVFLSVPQRGTNIADWVFHHHFERQGLVGAAREAMALGRIKPIDLLERRIVSFSLESTNLGQALRDVVADCSTEDLDDGPRGAPAHPYELSRALETEADVGLYLRQIDFDFGAIGDLCVRNPYPDADVVASPAHFDESTRSGEIAFWKEHHITTRSYATVGKLPFLEPPKDKLTLLHLLFKREPARADHADCDLPYRLAYRACARGPFDDALHNTGTGVRFGSGQARAVHPWENDGIANTASMLWPNAEATVIVEGDHGDIIGHYRARPHPQRGYDLLGSDSGFDDGTFNALWNDVFDFASGDGA